jgi:hypothetical protein
MIRVLLAAALMAVPGLARAADGVSGTWVSGAGPAAKVYVFKMQGDGFIGTVCGPCDDPSTVFRIAGGTIAAGGQVSFSIAGDGKASSSPVTLTRVVGEGTLTATVKTETAASTGRLNGRWVAAGRVAQQNFTLKLRDGNRVWGVICGPCAPDGVFMIEDGRLDGDAISFFIHHIDTPAGAAQTNPRRNLMRGVITGNVMKFTWVREGRESEPGGEMTLIGPIR